MNLTSDNLTNITLLHNVHVDEGWKSGLIKINMCNKLE